MFKLFHKKLNKKGFTLAEMLIVVAIIAILVAIAIPIFTNALEKAHKAAKDANIRSVKAVAIYEILDHWDKWGKTSGSSPKEAKSWTVEATIKGSDDNTNGKITITVITPKENANPSSTLTYTTSETDGSITIKGLDILSADVTAGT